MQRQNRLPVTLNLLILALALGGLAINLLLLIRHLSGGGLAGCGGGSGCEELLGSRWSQVLGLPVTGFGCGVYVALMVSLTAKCRRLFIPCLGLIAGAAAWFVFVQAVLLGRFCPWCMTAHGIGAGIVLLGCGDLAMRGRMRPALETLGLFAAVAVLGISMLQVLGPLPATHRIGEVHSVVESRATAIHARGSGRKVGFDGGRKTYDLSVLPHLGRTDAKRVMVEYFDYACDACQTMRGYLDALMERHPADLCVVILPVPLERSCNPSLTAGDIEHPGSCELARISLALWRAKPEAFAAFHHSLLEGVSADGARREALGLVSRSALDAALRDPWIDELIHANILDWVAFSDGTRQMPQLLITGKRILHGLPSGEAEFIRVMERELGL